MKGKFKNVDSHKLLYMAIGLVGLHGLPAQALNYIPSGDPLSVLTGQATDGTFTRGTAATNGGCVSGAGPQTPGKITTNGTTANPISSGTYNNALGCNARIDAAGIAGGSIFGSFGVVSGTGGSAFGHLAKAVKWGTAIGLEAEAGGVGSTALGFGANASADDSVAIGSNSAASGTTLQNPAYGFGTTATGGEVNVANGINGRRITGVAPGSSQTDAANVGQVDLAGQRSAAAMGAGAALDTVTGEWTAPNFIISTISASGVITALMNADNVGAAFDRISTNLVNLAAVAVKYDVAGGNTITLGGSGEVEDGPAVTIKNLAAGALNAESLEAVNGSQLFETNMNSAALRNRVDGLDARAENLDNQLGNLDKAITNTSAEGVKYDDSKIRDQVTFNKGSAATRLTNVAQGVLSEGSTDAVNGGQLLSVEKAIKGEVTAVKGHVKSVEGTVAQVAEAQSLMMQNNSNSPDKPQASGTNALAIGRGAAATGDNAQAQGNGAQATATNSVALGSHSVADRENSVSVGSADQARQITHVSAGTRGTDAVNFEQLSLSVANINNNTKAYTDQRYAELKKDLRQQSDMLSAGIAGAMAMASLPQPYTAGASMTAASVGNYRGQSSLALGVSTVSSDGRWVSKLQGNSDTQGQFGVAMGVGFQW